MRKLTRNGKGKGTRRHNRRTVKRHKGGRAPSKVLLQSLVPLGLQFVPSPGDGNCFFHTLEQYFVSVGTLPVSPTSGCGKGNALALRKSMVEYIKSNPEIHKLAIEWGIPLEEDLPKLATPGEYDFELFNLVPTIAATQYDIKILIYPYQKRSRAGITEGDAAPYGPMDKDWSNLPTVHMLYTDGIHYDLLLPTSKNAPVAPAPTAKSKAAPKSKATPASKKTAPVVAVAAAPAGPKPKTAEEYEDIIKELREENILKDQWLVRARTQLLQQQQRIKELLENK